MNTEEILRYTQDDKTTMHHLHELFSHECPNDRGLLAGCDVRVRLIVALAAILAVVMSTCIWFGLIALACCLIGLAAARTSPKVLASRHDRTAGVGGRRVCWRRLFMTGTTPLASIDLGVWRLTATREGFLGGALVACRVLGSLGIVMVFCQHTSMQELFAALRWAKVPHAWIEIAVLMYRYLYILFEQASCVVVAQMVRLGYRTLRRSIQSAGSLAGIVILRSLDQAEKSHDGHDGPGLSRRLAASPLADACRGVNGQSRSWA